MSQGCVPTDGIFGWAGRGEAPQPESPWLSADEHLAIATSAALWNTMCRIVGNGASRDADLAEIGDKIHAIQRMVLAQAAARAHPTMYRLLGEEVRS